MLILVLAGCVGDIDDNSFIISHPLMGDFAKFDTEHSLAS